MTHLNKPKFKNSIQNIEKVYLFEITSNKVHIVMKTKLYDWN